MSAAVVWIGWLVLFLVYELYAAKSRQSGDTFSENTWDWFGVRRPKPWGLARRAVLAAFLLSLTGHLVMGWTVVPVCVLGAGVGVVIVRAVGWERKEPR
jgi:hypothetical protein